MSENKNVKDAAMTESIAKKSYGDMYIGFTMTHGVDDIDPLTLSTPAKPDTENIEELTKLVEAGDISTIDQPNIYVMRVGKKGFQPYETDTAYNYYYIKNNVNMITKEVIPDVQKHRIMIYKNFKDQFADYKYDSGKIETLFLKYLNSNGTTCTDGEVLELKRFLVFDTSDAVCSNLGTKDMTYENRMVFRDISKTALNKMTKGTWIIRPSSISNSESNKIYVRVLSINTGTSIIDLPIIHVWGYGYLVTLWIDRGFNLEDFDFKTAIGTWYPSLLDILMHYSNNNIMVLSKYYKVPKTSYCIAESHKDI